MIHRPESDDPFYDDEPEDDEVDIDDDADGGDRETPDAVVDDPTVLRLGDRGPEVDELIRQLRRRGFYPKARPVETEFGQATRQAVRAVQVRTFLVPTGEVDELTRAAIFRV